MTAFADDGPLTVFRHGSATPASATTKPALAASCALEATTSAFEFGVTATVYVGMAGEVAGKISARNASIAATLKPSPSPLIQRATPYPAACPSTIPTTRLVFLSMIGAPLSPCVIGVSRRIDSPCSATPSALPSTVVIARSRSGSGDGLAVGLADGASSRSVGNPFTWMLVPETGGVASP